MSQSATSRLTPTAATDTHHAVIATNLPPPAVVPAIAGAIQSAASLDICPRALSEIHARIFFEQHRRSGQAISVPPVH